jgi:polyferredoxin
VAVALTDPTYSIPMVVTAVFFLPLVVALFFGRTFCGGVCPLLIRNSSRFLG